MAGKCYYLTTVGDWRRHSARFAHSHYVALEAEPSRAAIEPPKPGDATRILLLVEADEGAHNALQDDAAFELLPHPLVPKGISDSAAAALAGHGIGAEASTFDVTEVMGRVHPLLRFRVF